MIDMCSAFVRSGGCVYEKVPVDCTKGGSSGYLPLFALGLERSLEIIQAANGVLGVGLACERSLCCRARKNCNK